MHSLSRCFQAAPLHRTSRFFKRHEYGKRHGSLNQTGTSFAAASLKIRCEGVEKSGGFHQEFVKEVSFRKGITFYTFLIKRAGFAQGLFPTMCVCGWGARVLLKPFCRDDSSNRDEYSPQTLHSQQVRLMWLRLEWPCRVGSTAPDRF